MLFAFCRLRESVIQEAPKKIGGGRGGVSRGFRYIPRLCGSADALIGVRNGVVCGSRVRNPVPQPPPKGVSRQAWWTSVTTIKNSPIRCQYAAKLLRKTPIGLPHELRSPPTIYHFSVSHEPSSAQTP